MKGLEQKAKKEGSLSLYAGTREDTTAEWIKGFENKYGIQVDMYRDGSTTLYQKWAQEVRGGVNNADVIIQNVHQLMEDAKSKGWIAPYKTENFTDFDFGTLLPADSDLVGTVYPLYQSLGVVVWNTEVLSKAQQAKLKKDPVGALADPSLKGLVALADPGGATTIGNYANIILNQGGTYGWGWAESVANNNPAKFQSQVPIAEQLVKGEYGATLATDTLYNDYIDDGAPVQYRYPKPTSSALWMFAMAKEAPHPYAARLFMEWATSPQAQDRMSDLSAGVGSRKGWTDDRPVAQEPWYHEPTPWFGYRTEPRLQGENLEHFVEKVDSTMGLG